MTARKDSPRPAESDRVAALEETVGKLASAVGSFVESQMPPEPKPRTPNHIAELQERGERKKHFLHVSPGVAHIKAVEAPTVADFNGCGHATISMLGLSIPSNHQRTFILEESDGMYSALSDERIPGMICEITAGYADAVRRQVAEHFVSCRVYEAGWGSSKDRDESKPKHWLMRATLHARSGRLPRQDHRNGGQIIAGAPRHPRYVDLPKESWHESLQPGDVWLAEFVRVFAIDDLDADIRGGLPSAWRSVPTVAEMLRESAAVAAV